MVFSDAKTLVKVMHCKIVFVKVESSAIEIFESVNWSRRCYSIRFINAKKVQHIGEVRSCKNRNKTYIPVFYRGNKTWVLVLVCVIKSLVLAHSWFNTYAPEPVPMVYYRDQTWVKMFYFLNKETAKNREHTSIW